MLMLISSSSLAKRERSLSISTTPPSDSVKVTPCNAIDTSSARPVLTCSVWKSKVSIPACDLIVTISSLITVGIEAESIITFNCCLGSILNSALKFLTDFTMSITRLISASA